MTDKNGTISAQIPKHVVCVGAVVLKDQEALLVRQAPGESLEGQWSIPWGFVDEDEFPGEAARREVMEESSIECEIEALLGVQQLNDQGWFALVFLGRHLKGTPQADTDGETDRTRYVNLAELLSFREKIEPWCEWITRRVLEGDYSVISQETENPYKPMRCYL